MDTRELIKLAAVLLLFGFVPVLLAAITYFRPGVERWLFALICFMSTGGIMQAADWAITLQFFEYRGHTKGYHFYFAEIPALALLLARGFRDWRSFRLIPPGLGLYIVYCAASFLSIVNAPAPELTIMALFRFLKVGIFFVAGYNFMRSENELRFFLRVTAATLCWQLLVVLKMKYLDGLYQVPGTFEHQNSLSMFTIMIGMVFLAVALGPKTPESRWCLAAYLACAIIQESTLSRAGLAFFALGSAAVALWSLFDRFTKRRVIVLASLGIVGMIGLAMTFDTILVRFRDQSNEASFKTRELLNTAAGHMFEDYRLGIGWNNFGLVMNRPFTYGQIIDDWEREGGATVDETHQKGIAESHYHLLLSETGIQGLLFYLLFISVFLWRNLRAVFHYRFHLVGALSAGIAIGCACNYLQSFLERVLTQPRNQILWMLLLAITARIHVWRRLERRWQTGEEHRSEFANSRDDPRSVAERF